jgi:hypothetical protein
VPGAAASQPVCFLLVVWQSHRVKGSGVAAAAK